MNEDLLFGLALNVLLTVVKNPKRVVALRRQLRKLRDVLVTLNLGD